jgi:putative phosphoribosyl transferase
MPFDAGGKVPGDRLFKSSKENDMNHSFTTIEIPIGKTRLAGFLSRLPNPTGLVLFVHGSGSSRHSVRNQFVAGRLQAAGFQTLLFDLLSIEEEHERANVFDINLLASRVVEATFYAREKLVAPHLPVGYFGASTGAAAALVAAAELQSEIRAVVSRGGRPDLAGSHLTEVLAPTLLLVGGEDTGVIELNRRAFGRLRCQKELCIIPGATHLFSEPGTLERASDFASGWFLHHLPVEQLRRAGAL